MFRELTRKKQMISEEECIELLKSEPRTFMFALVPEFITGKMVKEA